MANLEIRNTDTIGIIYIVDFPTSAFHKVTRILRNNKVKFEFCILNDGFRVEFLGKDITLTSVMALMGVE